MAGETIDKPTKYQMRRDAIIDAAAAVFAERGFHGAGTNLIAERIGIRQGSLYYYFASKEDALGEVCHRGIRDFLTGVQDIAASTATTATKLRAAVRNHLRPMVEHPDYVRTLIAQRQFLPADARHEIGRQVRLYERLLMGIIRTGVVDGTVRTDIDCELAVLGLIGECNAVFAWYGKRAANKSVSDIADAIADRFFVGIQR